MQHNEEVIIRKKEDGKRDSSLPDVDAGSSSTPFTNNNAPKSTEGVAAHTKGNPPPDDEFFDFEEDVDAGSSSTPSTHNNAPKSTEGVAAHTKGNPPPDDDKFQDYIGGCC